MSHILKDKIIQNLIHTPGMSFNELWNKEGESNKFAYHLKSMEENGLIEKKEDKYYLSSEGKKESIFLDGATGTKKKLPLTTVVIAVYKGDKIVAQKRLKDPFYGSHGIVGGKLDFGDKILECATKELNEETGLTADLKIAGISNFITYNDEEKAYHHVMFVVKATNPKGTLKKKIREGENYWLTKKEFLSKKVYPNIPYFLDWLDDGRFFIAEFDRFQKNHEFTDIKIKSVTWH